MSETSTLTFNIGHNVVHRSVLVEIEKVQLGIEAKKTQHRSGITGNRIQRVLHCSGKPLDVSRLHRRCSALKHKQIGGRLWWTDHVLDTGHILNRAIVQLGTGGDVKVSLSLKIIDKLVGN